MNKQNFEAQDRFPLSTQALTFMQNMIFASAQLALIGGETYILSGCDQTGGTVTDGVIVIKGEVMSFRGGTAVDTITIIEEVEPVSAGGLTFDKARVRRYAKFASGSGDNYYNWSDFKKIQTNKQLEEMKATVKYVDDEIKKLQIGGIPVGLISLWSGNTNTLPDGWALCDGQTYNGTKTPDLRGRFVVGYNASDADYDTIGKTGGEKTHTLTIDEMPSHNHYLKRDKDGDAAGRQSDEAPFDYTHTGATVNTSYAGGGKAHENRPPYYVLAYIMFVGIEKK